MDLLIKNAYIKEKEPKVDIYIKDGKIQDIKENIDLKDEIEVIDARGRVVLPTLVECHIHPDKAYLEERKPNVSGTLEEAISNTAYLKSRYTYEDVYERSERVIKNVIKNGTTIMRAHPDVDPHEKTLGVEVLLDLKDKYKDILDMQIVAFPQEGFIEKSEVYDMLVKSLEMGADVIGGCPYGESTVENAHRQIEAVFDLAEKYNVPVDMHADFGTDINDPVNNVIEKICDVTIERGYQGKVSLGHVTTLGSLDEKVASPIFEKIAKAGITIIPLPATDLFMTGSDQPVNMPRGMAPVWRMVEHGINVATSTNNIRNAFTPFNNGNILNIAYILQVAQKLGSAKQRLSVVDMITYNSAKAMGIEDSYGIGIGKAGDVTIFDSYSISDLVNDQPRVSHVVKRGKIIVENNCEQRLSPIL